ncbi:hypothetical protein [Pseudomonas sp. Irchel s3h14]|uniref:hypothetical protein n=1 Tax=Pseudomonas sp. Irchel s3h14 TaxID=2009179 RepID=UPI00114014DC|nr:hypothetical protein [Pseudomonas sp. Irchel s3h14]
MRLRLGIHACSLPPECETPAKIRYQRPGFFAAAAALSDGMPAFAKCVLIQAAGEKNNKLMIKPDQKLTADLLACTPTENSGYSLAR